MRGCGVIIMNLKSMYNACFVFNSLSLERDPVDQSLEQVMMQHRLHHRWHGHTPVRDKGMVNVKNTAIKEYKIVYSQF
jgi:hypothetical protein